MEERGLHRKIKSVIGLSLSFFFLWIFSINCGKAQSPEIAFKHLSTTNGLSNFTVLSIAQDQQGFMWFGTMDGLNRFDGKQIRTYKVDDTDPFSLGNNFIYSLLCTSDSGMWVGTSQGLFFYDYFHDNFHLLPLLDDYGNPISEIAIKALAQDNSFLWIGTSKGLFRYDLVNKGFDSFLDTQIGKTKIDQTIEAIHKSKDGKIWIGGKQGLFYYQDGIITRVENSPNLKYNDATTVITIISDDIGRIWFGTVDLESGLMIYNPETKKFKELNEKNNGLPHNKVNCLFRFSNGNIWAGTTWGLAIIDQKNFNSKHLLYERSNPGSISQNSIKEIFQGENGVIWVGTYSGGVNYFDQRSQLIKHETNIYQNEYSLNFNIVSSIFEDSKKNLWIGTEYGGVNIYDKQRKTYKVLKSRNEANSLINDNIKSIIEDKKGRYFIATQFGLSIYNPTNNSFFNVDENAGARGKLSFEILHDLCEDNLGNIWIGCQRWIGTSKVSGFTNFLMYDIEKDSIIHFYPDEKNEGIIRGGVNSIIYDKYRNIIWSGGDSGLNGFNLETKKYISSEGFLKLSDKFNGVIINDILLDQNGLLWVATFGHGLYLIDFSTFESRQIGPEEGLKETSFYSLIDDNKGNIWVSANAHLIKIPKLGAFDSQIQQIENYGIQEGFPPQQYFRNASHKGSDGTLYFGGDDGYIAFDPLKVKKVVLHPSVNILDITVSGKSLEIKTDSEGQVLNLGAQEKVNLTYDQSSFAIEFFAPNFINPENTWYQYQLSGIHDSWQDLGNTNTINFTKLKAGDYGLKIRASSDPGNFAEGFTAFEINVAPPYWRTPVAYLLYIILILTLLYLFFTVSRKWERLNQNLKFEHLQNEKEKEFNQQRIKFFTDISHELRTPLTLILAPLERIVHSNFGNAKIKNQLILMLRNGDRMLQLINQLLDLRKLETGHIQLKVAKGNIANFVKEVSLSFRELAQDQQIDFEVQLPKKMAEVWFDRDKFEIILFNLLSNALKFTPKNGKIVVSIEQVSTSENGQAVKDIQEKKGKLKIKVFNTGRGIPENQITHIFERFYSGKNINEDKHYSSGVGLEIVKNLVDLHKGEIEVKSTFDEKGEKGETEFTLTLQPGKKHFAKAEIFKTYKSSEDISNYKKTLPPMELESPEQGKDENTEKACVLVVEDNNEVRELVVDIFKDHYDVLKVDNGADGLKTAKEKIPDLIISDIMMPGIDGIELCRRLKTDLNTSHIPVILLTARTAVTFKYEGLETGADDYIVKPFSVEELKIRAENLIKQRKLLKEKFGQPGYNLPTDISLTSVDEKLMQKTVDFIIEHIGDTDLTVEKIAKEVGMSRSSFYRKIKALTDRSASEFLRNVKMNHAAELLKTNKVRASEVRHMVGITDADYFRDCFKKQFQMTPKEFISSQEK